MSENKLHIVYDMTGKCPWECAICCMNAKNTDSIRETELTFRQKLDLMDGIADYSKIRPLSVDFSGGELLTNSEENLVVIERLAASIGKKKIGLSVSGYGIDDACAERISRCASDVEMTMDVVPGTEYTLRPRGYALAAAKALPLLKRHGMKVGIQTVLAKSNSNEENLRALYGYLCDNGVDEWSFITFFPSGRGKGYLSEVLSMEDKKRIVSFIQQLDAENTAACKPAIDFHYSMPGHKKESSVCRCVSKSVGILFNGDVTGCFWAVDETGHSLPRFTLGNVGKQSFSDTMRSEIAMMWGTGVHPCTLMAS